MKSLGMTLSDIVYKYTVLTIWFPRRGCKPGNSEGNSQDDQYARSIVDFKFTVEEKDKIFLEEITQD